MSPSELIAKLVALIPPPRLHLIRYAGILARNSKHRKLVVKDSVDIKNDPQHPANSNAPYSKYRPPSMYLLKRVFNIDISTCPFCKNGRLKIIASIEDPETIRKILTHLGLPTQVPNPWPARAPPYNISDESGDGFERQVHFDDC
jgi:ATP-dependent helicase YprA (DUF1998 family)